ncbi:MAG: RNA-directed DNA polymerase [Clostridia bacterium]|nr:RNA-directed DNA polymerase [Clostridia bacterium]
MYQEIMCDFGNIRDAYRLAHRGKSDAPEVVEFDKQRIYNLHKLRKKLIEKRWDEIFKYYSFTVTEPKQRVIDALTFEGRIVQHILCDRILRPYYDKRLVIENAACRRGKGTVYAMQLLRKGMLRAARSGGDVYILKIDVKKYFPSIDREILKKLISGFPDAEVRELLYYIIDRSPGGGGIPIGNQSSQWFALLYLDAIDRIIKTRDGVLSYVRYMDDLVVIGGKETLINLLRDLSVFADNERKLRFNAKTQIMPFHKGISFLGWRFLPKGERIVMRVDGGKRRFRVRKIREIYAKFRKGVTTFGEFCDELRSTVVNLRLGDTYAFRLRYNLGR